VVILDLWLPGIDGMTVLERLRAAGRAAGSSSSPDTAMSTAPCAPTRLGAYDFLEKPLSHERVLLTVNHAVADRKLPRPGARSAPALHARGILVGESDVMKRLDDRSAAPRRRTAACSSPARRQRKEIVARTLHGCRSAPSSHRRRQLRRHSRDLIESELSGIARGRSPTRAKTQGKVELADGGTLFLDEVGDMSLERSRCCACCRSRVPEGGRAAADHGRRAGDRRDDKQLDAEIASGAFRSDLYYRST